MASCRRRRQHLFSISSSARNKSNASIASAEQLALLEPVHADSNARERERAQREKLTTTTARELAEAEGWEAVTTRRLADESNTASRCSTATSRAWTRSCGRRGRRVRRPNPEQVDAAGTAAPDASTAPSPRQRRLHRVGVQTAAARRYRPAFSVAATLPRTAQLLGPPAGGSRPAGRNATLGCPASTTLARRPRRSGLPCTAL